MSRPEGSKTAAIADHHLLQHEQDFYRIERRMMSPPLSRFVHRSPELENYDALIRLAERLGDAKSRGLERQEIRKLPSARVNSRHESSQSWCVVCMSDFAENQMVSRLVALNSCLMSPFLPDDHSCGSCPSVITSSMPSASINGSG